MHALIDKATALALERLNSSVKFATVVTPRRDDEGDQALDRNGKPINAIVIRAELYTPPEGKDMRQWLGFEAGSHEAALAGVLELAKKAPRPAATAADLQAQLDAAKAESARKDQEIERLKSGTATGSRSNVTDLRGTGIGRAASETPPVDPPDPAAKPARATAAAGSDKK